MWLEVDRESFVGRLLVELGPETTSMEFTSDESRGVMRGGLKS